MSYFHGQAFIHRLPWHQVQNLDVQQAPQFPPYSSSDSPKDQKSPPHTPERSHSTIIRLIPVSELHTLARYLLCTNAGHHLNPSAVFLCKLCLPASFMTLLYNSLTYRYSAFREQARVSLRRPVGWIPLRGRYLGLLWVLWEIVVVVTPGGYFSWEDIIFENHGTFSVAS